MTITDILEGRCLRIVRSIRCPKRPVDEPGFLIIVTTAATFVRKPV